MNRVLAALFTLAPCLVLLASACGSPPQFGIIGGDASIDVSAPHRDAGANAFDARDDDADVDDDAATKDASAADAKADAIVTDAQADAKADAHANPDATQCVSGCQSDLECENSCPAFGSHPACCDLLTGTCYRSLSVCP